MNSTGNNSTEALRKLPPTTFGVIALCVLIHFIQSTLRWSLHLFTMCPRLVIYQHEYYRVITSAFFHANLIHIGMNMLSTAAISSTLEKRLGTLRLLLSICWATVLTSTIYMTIAYGVYKVLGYEKLMYQHSVGFSGVLFHLSVLECQLHPLPRTVFGYFSVPAFVYPWVLLVVLQVMMPNLSFLGHLAGILNGTLEYYGVLDVLFAGDSFLVRIESMSSMRGIVAMDTYVGMTQVSGHRLRSETSLPFFQSIGNAFLAAIKYLKLIFVNMRTCLCGRISQITNTRFRFWKRRTCSEIESGVIRPPEFYDSSLYENENDYNSEGEHHPLESEIV